MRQILSFVRGWWSRHPMLHPLVAGALVLAVMPARYGRPTRFADLGSGQHVAVSVTSNGCFARSRGRITFTSTATGARYTVREGVFRRHTRSGRLSRGDVLRLDRAMDRLRSPRKGEWCTLETRVEVSRTIAGVPVSREVYTSRSCSREPGALSFRDLLPE